ncbi:unnamed protein product [Amaranthus hypochondriacus]
MPRGNNTQTFISCSHGEKELSFRRQNSSKGFTSKGVNVSKTVKCAFMFVPFLKQFGNGVKNVYRFVTKRNTYSSKKSSLERMRSVDSVDAHSREAIDDCIEYIKSCSPSPASNQGDPRSSV